MTTDSTDREEGEIRSDSLVEKSLLLSQDKFLSGYGAGGTISAGLKAAKIVRRTQELWRSKDVNGFRARFEAAHKDYCDSLEDKFQELIAGLKPGNNPLVLIARANAEMPEKYRPNAIIVDDTAKDVLKAIKDLGNRNAKAEADAVQEAEKITTP